MNLLLKVLEIVHKWQTQPALRGPTVVRLWAAVQSLATVLVLYCDHLALSAHRLFGLWRLILSHARNGKSIFRSCAGTLHSIILADLETKVCPDMPNKCEQNWQRYCNTIFSANTHALK